MPVFQIHPPDGSAVLTFDLTPVLQPRTVGLEDAWEKGCEIYQRLLMLLTILQNNHNRVKANLYQLFKQEPVNKDATMGPVNPGTDAHFNNTWLPAHTDYQYSRTQRDLVEGTIEALKQTYLPRLRMLFDKSDYGERNVPSQAGAMPPQPMAQPYIPTAPPVAAPTTR